MDIFNKVISFVKAMKMIRNTIGTAKMLRRGISIMLQFISGPPRKEMVIETTEGFKLALVPNDQGISTELKTFKTHEPLTTYLVKKNVHEGMTVIDIGSNIGYYAILESKLVGNKGKIVAIEPVKTNFSYLIKNIKLNKLKNLELINIAMSNKNGTVKMIDDNYSNWSRVVEDISIDKNHKFFHIKTSSGNILLKKYKRVDCVRMDIEGYESTVIDGSLKILKKFKPILLIELHPFLLGKRRYIKLLNHLKVLGYDEGSLIIRDTDYSLVYNLQDIKKFRINDLIDKPIITTAVTILLKYKVNK